jgi:hypothetical protein
MQQQLADHHPLHERMVAAGLAKASSSSSKAAAATGGSSQQQAGAPSTPAKSPAAAAADGAAAAGAGDASKRVWVAPRVLLRGSKGMPMWWKREHDDLLMQGTYAYGFLAGTKLNSIVEDIMADPKLGLRAKLRIDPEAVLREQTARLAPPPTITVRMVSETQADGSLKMLPQQVVQQAPAPPVDPVKLAAAQQEKLRLEQAHPGIDLYSSAEWRKLVLSLAQRLKRVRAALLDPEYKEPETPSKQLPVIHPRPVQPPAAAAGAGTVQGSAQQRLQLTPAGDGSLTYKGKKVIGGGLNAPPAAAARPAPPAAAAAAGAQRTPPSSGGVSRPVLSPAELAYQQRLLGQRDASIMRGAMAIVAAASAARESQDRKRQAEQQLSSASKRANGSTGASTAALQQQQQQQQQQAMRAIAAEASRHSSQQTVALQQRQQQQQAAMAEAARQAQMQQQRDMLQRQQAMQVRLKQQQQHEVVDLLSDDSSDDFPAAPPPARTKAPATTPASAGAATAAAAPPSSGLVVRRVPVGADLSQEQSVDEPSAPEGAPAGDTPAKGATSSGGKQHMHQLLGNGQSQPAAGTSAAADHPVYGTPAGAAAAPGPSTKRKQGKEDPKQRKLTGFFAVAK